MLYRVPAKGGTLFYGMQQPFYSNSKSLGAVLAWVILYRESNDSTGYLVSEGKQGTITRVQMKSLQYRNIHKSYQKIR